MNEENRENNEAFSLSHLLSCQVTLLLLVMNLACFVLEELLGSSEDGQTLIFMGAFYTPLVQVGQFYRIISCMFLHIGISHLMNNMIALVALGSYLESKIGHLRFLFIYLLGGIAGNLTDYVLDILSGTYAVSAGASGGLYALFGALVFLVLFRRSLVREISLMRLVLALVCLAVGTMSEPNVDVAAHAGGFVGGFVVCALSFFGDKRIV